MEFYDSEKGLGFIRPDRGGKGAFVHVSALARCGMPDLIEGQKVSFDAEVDERSGRTFVMRINQRATNTKALR